MLQTEFQSSFSLVSNPSFQLDKIKIEAECVIKRCCIFIENAANIKKTIQRVIVSNICAGLFNAREKLHFKVVGGL